MQLLRIFAFIYLLCSFCSKGNAQLLFPSSQYLETGSKTIFCTFRDADGVWWNGTSQGLFSTAQLIGQTIHDYSRHQELYRAQNEAYIKR